MAIVAALCVYYYNVDPAASGTSPRCLLKYITGYDCPGCGSQRALHALLHGHAYEAWRYNPAILPALLLAGVYGFLEASPRRFARLERFVYNPIFIMLIAVAVVAWWVGRNLFLE